MSNIVDRFDKIKSKILSLKTNKQVKNIVVSKIYNIDNIKLLI